MHIDMPSPGARRSYWLEEALGHEAGEPCPPLRRDVHADVCVVGGGFAGLWAAWELIEREPGMRIALVESDICGGGASGRNGGFASSSWWDLSGLVGLFGDQRGLDYAQKVSDEVANIGTFVADHGIDCWWHHEGIMVGEAGEWQRNAHAADILLAERLGVPEVIVPRSAEEARSVADSPKWVSGMFVKDCAICQPARLARGIRRVLLERGVHIFERSPARRLEPGTPAVVRTADGAVRADQVVLTHGAWAADWPGFRRSFGTIVDYMVATEPIPERLEEIGWTSMIGVGDSRDMLLYLRPTEDGRIAIGGGAMGVVYGGRAGGRAATHTRRVAEVAARSLLWLFPQLEGIRFTHAWGGPIDLTAASVPFFQTLGPGNVHAGLGFSGHGLTQTRLGGRILASLVLGADDQWGRMPVVGPPLRRVPPEPLRYPALRALAWAMEESDRAADEGRRPSALVRSLGSIPEKVRPG